MQNTIDRLLMRQDEQFTARLEMYAAALGGVLPNVPPEALPGLARLILNEQHRERHQQRALTWEQVEAKVGGGISRAQDVILAAWAHALAAA